MEERKGSREKVKADADNPHAPVYARRPVGRLGTCPYWYGVGRLETCPYWCGNGREGEGGRGKVRATRRAPQHRH